MTRPQARPVTGPYPAQRCGPTERRKGTAHKWTAAKLADHSPPAWSMAGRRADLPEAHLHDLWHAGLILAAQSRATLAEVMRRAGHSSPAAMIYQHAAEWRDAEVAARLGRLAAVTTPNRTGT